MARIALLVCIFFLGVSWNTVSVAGMNMKEGKWEITTKMEIQGMPFTMPPTVTTNCLTQKDSVPQKGEPNQDCKMSNMKISGDTVSWTMHCQNKDGSKMDGSGQVTYKGDRFDGVVNVTMSQPKEGTMQATQHMSGRRIGDCK